MSDIGMHLERLKSPNKDTRYEACEGAQGRGKPLRRGLHRA